MILLPRILDTLAGISLMSAVVNSALAAGSRRSREHVFLAVMGVAGAIYSWRQVAIYGAENASMFLDANRIQMFCTPVFIVALVWFAAGYSGWKPKRLLVLYSIVMVAIPWIRLSSDSLLTYTNIRGIRDILLPWGEAVHVIDADTTRLMALYYALIGIVPVLFITAAGVRTLRRSSGDRKRGLALIAGPIFMSFVAVNDYLVDACDIQWVYMGELSLGVMVTYFTMVMLERSRHLLHVQRALVESEEKLRVVFDNSFQLAGLLSPDGTVLSINRASLEMIGVPADEIVGKAFWETPWWRDTQQSIEKLKKSIEMGAAGHFVRYETTHRDQSGKLRFVDFSLKPVFVDGAVSFLVAEGRDFTDKRQAEESLRASEERFRRMAEGVLDGLVIAENKEVVFANRRACEIFGLDLESVKKIRGIDLAAPEEKERIATLPMSYHSALRTYELSFWIVRPDGQRRCILNRYSHPLPEKGEPDRLYIFTTDITEQELTLRKLKESQDRFTQLATNIQEVFFLYDLSEKKSIYISPMAEEILGMSDSSDIDSYQSTFQFLDPESRLLVSDAAVDSSSFFSREVQYQHPVKGPRWLRIVISPVHEPGGGVYRLAGVISDVTEARLAREREEEHRRQLIQADKLASLGLLVSGVAHEVNNPNNLIMLNADVANKILGLLTPLVGSHLRENGSCTLVGMTASEAWEKMDSLLKGIVTGSQRIQRIVQNLCAFARTDSGDRNALVNLNNVVESSISIIGTLIRKSTSRLCIDNDPCLPMVRGNFQKLEQVVINLITNACHALSAKEKMITIRTRQEERTVVLEVEDEGSGISPEVMPRIMDPFFTTKGESGGTGLGLSISYGIVKDHHGMIEFASTEGRGTTARVCFPIADSHVPAISEEIPAS